jgi:hypothetical protein
MLCASSRELASPYLLDVTAVNVCHHASRLDGAASALVFSGSAFAASSWHIGGLRTQVILLSFAGTWSDGGAGFNLRGISPSGESKKIGAPKSFSLGRDCRLGTALAFVRPDLDEVLGIWRAGCCESADFGATGPSPERSKVPTRTNHLFAECSQLLVYRTHLLRSHGYDKSINPE